LEGKKRKGGKNLEGIKTELYHKTKATEKGHGGGTGRKKKEFSKNHRWFKKKRTRRKKRKAKGKPNEHGDFEEN